jgi:hypothetical protein
VTNNPANSQSAPTELKTVEKNFDPAISPTAAKNSAMPNSRNARFTLAGMCQAEPQKYGSPPHQDNRDNAKRIRLDAEHFICVCES